MVSFECLDRRVSGGLVGRHVGMFWGWEGGVEATGWSSLDPSVWPKKKRGKSDPASPPHRQAMPWGGGYVCYRYVQTFFLVTENVVILFSFLVSPIVAISPFQSSPIQRRTGLSSFGCPSARPSSSPPCWPSSVPSTIRLSGESQNGFQTLYSIWIKKTLTKSNSYNRKKRLDLRIM